LRRALTGGATINAFAEPQLTVAHDGAGQPKFGPEKSLFEKKTWRLPDIEKA